MVLQMYTERDVARVLRCSVAALRRMRRERRGPSWMKLGRLVRYPVPSLDEFIRSNLTPPPNISRRVTLRG